ncbi:LysE/ArgO family amino acid transporter [Microbacterium sp. 18062]|uniref:LysE/ArgO family amino acid transporter n=1 Tax=Microbacterium sp. 18062 TaxID=2681410 RepID=UPI00135B3039|nr:LysE/ArgO family amino acid transporter [Microbacterium sp. 18062]
MTTALLSGFVLGLSLIVAIGAQNLFVLRQGIRRENILIVATVCIVSDALLILLGVSGIGALLHSVPWLITVVRWAGAAFLLAYAFLAARRAFRPGGEALRVETADVAASARSAADTPAAAAASVAARTVFSPTPTAASTPVGPRSAPIPVLLACLALTWLNPHVYLDTVFLLGSIAASHGDVRWWFAVGAVAASTAWFVSLAYGARLLGRWLATPRAWRILDSGIAVVMTVLAVGLVTAA